MAVEASSNPMAALDAPKARLAALAASLVGLLCTAAAVVGLIAYVAFSEARSDVVVYLMLLTAFAALGLIGGAQLLRGSAAAQQFLLVYWLAVCVMAVLMTLGVLLWQAPEGLAKLLGAESGRALAPWATLAGVLLTALSGALVAVLATASEGGTRQRYASMVIISVGAVAALVLAVNMIGQYENPQTDRRNYVHSSWETLGRYGLSERTKKILGDIKGEIHLTCVYTSADEAKKTDELRPRVLELLDDMKVYGNKVTVDNVTSDAEKARLLGRLRGQIGTQAKQHDEFLRKFQKEFPEVVGKLKLEAERWEKYPPDAYLNMWSLPVEVANVVASQTGKLTQVQKKLDAALAGPGLPDYAELTRQVKDAAKDFKDLLDKSVDLVARVGKIAAAAGDEAKRKAAAEALTQCQAAADEMLKDLGKADDPEPADPTAVLTKHVELARKTAEAAVAAAQRLDNLAGEDLTELLSGNRFYAVAAGPVEVSLSDFFRIVAQNISQQADQAEAIVKNAKADFQKKTIVQSRAGMAQLAQSLQRARTLAEELLGRLAAVDAASKADMAAAEKKELFAEPLAKLKALGEEIDKLPKLEGSSLSSDVAGENIVILEAGGKTQVVGFDEVWPLRARDFTAGPADQGQRRVFNGDAAIGSKVLAMTNQPFATVLMTYWGPGPDMPPQMARMSPRSDIPLEELSAVRKRLQEANFEVKDWNLNENMPDANEAKDRPKVLVVLPPPPDTQESPFQRQPMPTPKFLPEHRQKVTDAIDKGIPAVFLTTFSPPRQAAMFMPPTQAPYAYDEYLRDAWGIDAMTEYLVVPAVTDEKVPGRYKVDGQRFSYLPLSAFSDHPIGKPLQTQRVLWANLCPIGRSKDARGEPLPPPSGVSIEPLLSVPDYWKATWATRRIEDLLRQFQNVEGSYIWPDYAAGDIPVPFDVAVAATRAEDKDKKIGPARIVVLGVGQALMDGYLDREIPVRDDKGTISLSDPPRADADLLINGVYWLTGREGLIASGPVQAVMREIGFHWKVVMFAFYFAVLPLSVVGIGMAVLWRRRS